LIGVLWVMWLSSIKPLPVYFCNFLSCTKGGSNEVPFSINANGDNKIGSKVILNAYSNVYSTTIYAGAYTDGFGGSVKIVSQTGGITIAQNYTEIGNEVISTSSGSGNAGNVTLQSISDIKLVNNISASSSGGNGGVVKLTSTYGNIESGSINTSSQNGAGGNIRIDAGGESIKVINTLKQNDIDYSIISAGATANGKVTIQRKSGSTGTFFAVGDATYNGTKGAIGAGKDVNGKDNSLLVTTIVTGTYVDGNIRILTPDIPASSLSKPRTIPAESPTTTYSFAPVSSLNVQGFIDARQYAKAIVALDNLRTIEFYQSQGNTSPTVPQLNSVNQIKTFLNAGDIAAGTKSAMIYTFLSGTTQANPSGTSLNLFAVTATSDVIYRTIPLINGLYLDLTVKSTVGEFGLSLQDSSSEDYKDPASRLYDLIFRPLKDALSIYQVNNLIFSNDSLFRTIPLAALYDKQTQTTGRYLVQDFSSSVTPSFQVIEKDRYKSLKSANVLKMGSTSFGFLKDQIPTSWKALSGTRAELENIAQIELQTSPNVRHSPIYLNNQFSKENFQTLISKNDAPIIHLSTHGRKNSIVLGTINSSKESNEISASELRQLQGLSNKELLVFSACQTILSDNFSYGMAGAALVAGVKSTIASYWDVSDDGTVPVMTGFYQQLLGNGLSKTKSLQKAQIAALTSNYDHPRYWASFALAGNPW
jgi:CHAT domain-containing protein